MILRVKGTMGLPKIIWSTVSNFTTKTTIGGISNVGFSTSRVRQVLWLVIFFALTGYTIKLLSDNVSDYYEYNVTTTTEISYTAGQNFPAVTICNQNK